MTEEVESVNRGSAKIYITIMLLILFAGVTGFSLYNYFRDPGSNSTDDKKSAVTYKDKNAGKTETGKTSMDKKTTIGDVEKDGASLVVEAGIFPDGTELTVKHLTDKEAKEYKSGDIPLLSNPIELSAPEDVYKGEWLDPGVTLVVDIPEESIREGSSVLDYAFAYYDETLKDWRYMEPDWVDLEERKMQLTLMHFSIYGPVTVEEDKQIDKVMNEYLTAKLKHENDYNEAEEVLSPYLADLKKKMKLSEEAFAQLQRDILCQVMDNLQNSGPETAGFWRDKSQEWHFQGQGTLVTTCMKAKADKDPDLAVFAIEEYMAEATASVLLNGPWAKKLAMTGRLSKAAGAFAGGDYHQALSYIADVGINFIPYGYVASSTVDFVVKKSDELFTKWKHNEVEELYNIYKNGRDGYIQSVSPQNFEELWEYVDYGFFAKGRAVERLYNQDLIKKQFAVYGWGGSTFNDLTYEQQQEFTAKTRKQLEEYMKARFENEKKIEKMKKDEAEFVEDVLDCLRDSMYMDFFGEKRYRDINLSERLRKILEFRNQVSIYVDEKKMDKNHVYWGTLIRQMISDFDKDLSADDMLQKWLRFLDDEGILLDEFKGLLDISDDIFGEWDVTQVISEFKSDYYDAYMQQMESYMQYLSEAEKAEYEKAMKEYMKQYQESFDMYKNKENKAKMTIEDTLGDSVSVTIIYESAPEMVNTYTGTFDKESKVMKVTNDNPQAFDPGLELQFGIMNDKLYFEGKVDYQSDMVTYSYVITGYKKGGR